MASGRFSKQGNWMGVKPNKAGFVGDVQAGGSLTTAPAGLQASQGWSTLPGDRVIFSPADGVALSDLATGQLYTGTYRYVATQAGATANPQRGRAAFWVATPTGPGEDELYQVTSDEIAPYGVTLFAGVFLLAITKGNYWWIQESGKAGCDFRAAISGTPAIGVGVYLAAAGAGADVGTFDQIAAATAASTEGAIDNQIVRFVGVAETLPANGAISLVDLVMNRASFRW